MSSQELDYQSGFRNLEIACRLPSNILSEDYEYPPCPNCAENSGIFTRICENSTQFRCLSCSHEFSDRSDIVTSRRLPRPLRDDFAACVIGDASLEDQAAKREVLEEEIRSNLEKCDQLLSVSWFRDHVESGLL